MSVRSMVYQLYGRWLRRQLATLRLPRHIAIVTDGNRRWARKAGYQNVSVGHRYGAEHLATVLRWCAELGIRNVTFWVASADNIRRRDSGEVAYLMELAETVITDHVASNDQWRLHVAGQLDLLPDTTARALKEAAERSRHRSNVGELTIAIGYSGRLEVIDAVRDILEEASAAGRGLDEVAATLTEDDIADHLYLPDLPDPDLVIRTSGERRLSDFLLWQATRSDLYFCDVYWPAFRYVDLLRVLRSYGQRQNRPA